MMFLAAMALPALLWDRPLETAKALKAAGIVEIAVVADKVAQWKAAGFSARAMPPASCMSVPAPQVNMRANVARATSSPWVDSNSWRFVRNPSVPFCIDAPGKSAALAAAEAFAYGVDAYIKTDDAGVAALGAIEGLLHGAWSPEAEAAVADIGVNDDGSPATGEMLNLLSRRNLLYKVVKSPDSSLKLNVTPDRNSPDPSKQAYAVRQSLGDENRSLRLYGSEVVIARLTRRGNLLRVHLVNYSQRPVNGLRVRVSGTFPKVDLRSSGADQPKLLDIVQSDGGTEFTLSTMNEYAIVDLAPR